MMQSAKILIVDDSESQLDVINVALTQAGHRITVAQDGEEAWQKLKGGVPDLVIADVEMPKLGGLELIEKMNRDPLLHTIPVILMSGSRVKLKDRVVGLRSGSDDYILKPFEAEELIARIEAMLRRQEISLDANPLTHLPGNSSILRLIEQRILSQEPFVVLYVDLNDFKGYNDSYGFFKGDEVLLFTARTLMSAVDKVSEGKDFAGHVGGDDFVLVSVPERAVPLCEAIISEFDKGVREFYTAGDIKQGYVKGKDRRGAQVDHPIVSIVVAVVTNQRRKLTQVGQVSQIAAELKRYAKMLGKSRYVIDRRVD